MEEGSYCRSHAVLHWAKHMVRCPASLISRKKEVFDRFKSMVDRDVTHITVSGALVNRISRAMNIVGWFPGLL